MASIKPFKAIRPRSGMESQIASLPYDVFNRKEAKEYVQNHKDSFLKIDRAESLLSDEIDTYDSKVYEKALETYTDMKKSGQFIQDIKPCYYLYEQIMDGRSQTGLVAAASVFDYENNIIKKHENTRADKEIDRINHVDKLNAQTGPIFLAYRNSDSLNILFDKIKRTEPYTEFANNGVIQKCWIIDSDEDIDYITKTFETIPNLYIADGHHRCASACKVSKMRREADKSASENAEYNYFLSVIFPDKELLIMDYNRVIKTLNDMSADSFMEKISERFEIKEIEISDKKPDKKGDIYMFLKEKEYLLNLKKEFELSDPIGKLDVSVLQNNLLKPVLGIDDPKTDSRIDFVGGIRGVAELRKRMNLDAVCAFSMYPTSMAELFDVADADLLMPPKSTWFEPKLLSGLFIHEI